MDDESGKRISSRNTFFVKRIFPVLWFAAITLFLGAALAATVHARTKPSPVFFVAPLVMFGFGFWLMRRLVFDLADAVYDEGDALRVRFRGDEERIALANIINISYSGLTNPPRATLTLRQPGMFGKDVTFSPVQKVFGPLLRTSNPIVTDLIERVDAARRR
jgi:hypothetical protein